MIGSRANVGRPRLLLGLVATGLCWIVLTGSPVQAQRPQSLAPRTLEPAAPPPAQTTQPAQAQPPQVQPAQPSEAVVPAEAGTGSVVPLGVEAAPLAAIDPDSVGPLSRDQGGFDFDMWSGTRRGVVESMLTQMPAATVSPTLRSLMHRLLLTSAKAPAGEAKKSLVALRATELAAMGDAAGVEALLNATPSRDTDPALLRIEADSLFLESDNARVCALVASQSGTSSDVYWRKADIYCQVLAGEQDRAALSADLLRDHGDKDALFFDLFDTLTGAAKPKIDSMAKAQPLHIAMARAAKIALPADIVTSNQPAILRMVATTPSLPAEQRIDAAERAESMGVIDVKVLRELYAGISFTKDQLDKALSTAQSERSALSRALLYVRATRETVPTALAQVIQQALTLARGTGRYQTQARVYRDMIAGLAPTSDLLWLAPEASRALISGGDQTNVNRWFDLLRASAVLDEKSALVRNRLIPLARIAGVISDEDWNPDAIAAWYNAASVTEANTPADPDDVRAQAVLLFNLLEATGDTVPEAQWEKTVSGGSAVVPNAALWRQLNAASVAGRVGETIMLSAVAMGPAPLGETDATVLRFVVESLRGVGLVGEARGLAIEAAVSAGI